MSVGRAGRERLALIGELAENDLGCNSNTDEAAHCQSANSRAESGAACDIIWWVLRNLYRNVRMLRGLCLDSAATIDHRRRLSGPHLYNST